MTTGMINVWFCGSLQWILRDQYRLKLIFNGWYCFFATHMRIRMMSLQNSLSRCCKIPFMVGRTASKRTTHLKSASSSAWTYKCPRWWRLRIACWNTSIDTKLTARDTRCHSSKTRYLKGVSALHGATPSPLTLHKYVSNSELSIGHHVLELHSRPVFNVTYFAWSLWPCSCESTLSCNSWFVSSVLFHVDAFRMSTSKYFEMCLVNSKWSLVW